MPAPNKNFELTVTDLDLIETALREREAEAAMNDAGDEAREVHALLGRLHNQKEFYRPKSGVYLGG